jgi:four helix bundle protein
MRRTGWSPTQPTCSSSVGTQGATVPCPGLNIAEGYGKRSAAERCHHYDIARGSAHECGAVFDASKCLGLVDDERFVQGKTLLVRIVSMLVKVTQ